MSYKVDELFEISETYNGGYAIDYYSKRDCPDVTELEIPAEYNGKPVKIIRAFAFNCNHNLQRVYIPDSVQQIQTWAFGNSPELCEIRLPKNVLIEQHAFGKCPKLPAETIMAGLVGGTDLSKPFTDKYKLEREWDDVLRPDVFELVLKYDSFRELGIYTLYDELVWRGSALQFKMLEEAGKAPIDVITDVFIEFSVKYGHTELTAYLLDYKNRKFGFDGGDKLEL